MEAKAQWTQRWTLRPWLGEFGDAIGDPDWVNSEMHLEVMIKRVWRCTLRRWPSEFGYVLGDDYRAYSEIHWHPIIERVSRCTWRPGLGKLLRKSRVNLEIHFGGCDRARLDEYLEVVDGRSAECWDFIYQLVVSQAGEWVNVSFPMNLLWRTAGWWWICREVHRKLKLHSGVKSKSEECSDDSQSEEDAVLGVCCTGCMLYWVYAALGVCCTQCSLLVIAWRGREGLINVGFLRWW